MSFRCNYSQSDCFSESQRIQSRNECLSSLSCSCSVQDTNMCKHTHTQTHTHTHTHKTSQVTYVTMAPREMRRCVDDALGMPLKRVYSKPLRFWAEAEKEVRWRSLCPEALKVAGETERSEGTEERRAPYTEVCTALSQRGLPPRSPKP